MVSANVATVTLPFLRVTLPVLPERVRVKISSEATVIVPEPAVWISISLPLKAPEYEVESLIEVVEALMTK